MGQEVGQKENLGIAPGEGLDAGTGDAPLRTDGKLRYRCMFRAVLATYYRRELLAGEPGEALKGFLAGHAERHGFRIVKLEVSSAYLDITVEHDPRESIHGIVKGIRNRSAGFLKEHFPELKKKANAIWASAYLAGTQGGLLEEEVREFLDSRKKRYE